MIVAFGKTIEVAHLKTCTRRLWTDTYHESWVRAWKQGRYLHAAYDKSQRCGGKPIGKIDLKDQPCPYRERLLDMPEDDLIAEGGVCSTVAEFIDRYFDGEGDRMVSVVRYRFIPMEVPW